MAVLAAILPVVSSSSRLTLELYQAAAESTLASKDFIEVASTVNSFASILKQVGTFIKENDRLPSHEVYLIPFHSVYVSSRLLPDKAPAIARPQMHHASALRCGTKRLLSWAMISSANDLPGLTQGSANTVYRLSRH